MSDEELRAELDAYAAAHRAGLERDARAFGALWHARSIAVIGASDRPGSLGRLPVEHLQRFAYRGKIYPVRPDGATVTGLPSYPSVMACPGPIDLAMIMVAAERVSAAVDDCIAARVRLAIICSSGFAETGPAGAVLQDDLVAQARAGGLRLLGPNCIGAVGVEGGQVASFSPLFAGPSTRLINGAIGFVSQSGALGYGAVSLAFERGLGLGWIANTGNEADVTALEVMIDIAERPVCAGVLGYIERLDDLRALERLSRAGPPIAILKAGRTSGGQRAAASHTGALATEDRVVDAALRQLGIVRADDVDELLDLGDAFEQPRRPAGSRVAVITTSGGSGILAADAIESHGLQLAELTQTTTSTLDAIVPAYGSTANPVDVTATVMGDPALLDRALSVLIDDPGVDAVIACFCVLTEPDVTQVVSSLASAALRSGKPVLAARTGADHLAPGARAELRAAGIPTYPTPARAVRALAGLHQVAEHARRPHEGVTVSAGRAEGGPSTADEPTVKAALAADGIPVPRGRLVDSPDDAAAAVTEVGSLAVMKAVVPGLLHKSEADAVLLRISPAGAAAAYARLASLGGGVLVEEMITDAIEALVGIAPTPLGPVISVGVGGTLAEIVDDVSLRLLPKWPRDPWRDVVESMIDETRLGRLLAGARGAGPYDRRALVDAVLALGLAVMQWPPGFELDLNPVAVLPAGQGVRVLDAAYVPGPEQPPMPGHPHPDRRGGGI